VWLSNASVDVAGSKVGGAVLVAGASEATDCGVMVVGASVGDAAARTVAEAMLTALGVATVAAGTDPTQALISPAPRALHKAIRLNMVHLSSRIVGLHEDQRRPTDCLEDVQAGPEVPGRAGQA